MIFASEAGSRKSHLELQLAYAAPPTRAKRFFTTTTQDGSTHCSVDLRDFEMRAAREEQDAQMGRELPPREFSNIKATQSRWFLRVVGRGFSLKKYSIEFRIQTSLIDFSTMMTEALTDLEVQASWQQRLNQKALQLDRLAHQIYQPQQGAGREKRMQPAAISESESESALPHQLSALDSAADSISAHVRLQLESESSGSESQQGQSDTDEE
jgi:hypothetical protein